MGRAEIRRIARAIRQRAYAITEAADVADHRAVLMHAAYVEALASELEAATVAPDLALRRRLILADARALTDTAHAYASQWVKA